MVRSLLKGRNMPSMFWGEAVATAIFLLNRAPTKSLDGMTPFEAWHGRKPDVHFLRTFGCVAHVKTTKPHLKKLDDRSAPAVFIGYEPDSKAWRFYDPTARRAIVSRDAVFEEHTSWDWSKEIDYDAAAHTSDFSVEYTMVEHQEDAVAAEDFIDPSTPASAEFVSPPPDAAEYLDFDNDDDIMPRYRAVDNILGAATLPGLAPCNLGGELHLQIGEEPS
ncbi:unnamed protein product [Urochloa humidicola]